MTIADIYGYDNECAHGRAFPCPVVRDEINRRRRGFFAVRNRGGLVPPPVVAFAGNTGCGLPTWAEANRSGGNHRLLGGSTRVRGGE